MPPRDVPGLYVADEDINALLRSLPGLDGPMPEQVAMIEAAFAPLIELARTMLRIWTASAGAPFARCVRNVGLSPDETDVLAIVSAVDLHPARQRLVAYVQDSMQCPRITLSALRRLLGEEHLADRAVAPSGALRRTELVAVEEAGPWAARMAGITQRLAWALREDDSPDPDLPAGSRFTSALEPPSWSSTVPGELGLTIVHGADATSRVHEARRAAGPRPCLVTPLPETPVQWAAVVREAGITGSAVVVQLAEAPNAEAVDQLARAKHLQWILCSADELPLDRLPPQRWREIRVEDGTASDADWAAAFGIPAPDELRLTREQLAQVRAATGGDPGRLAEGVRRLAGGHLDTVATRTRPQRGWGDIVLPPDQLRRLHEVASRQRRRAMVYGAWGFPALPSTGVVALFAGPSGTGKTLAAEVLAADLGLDLYRVELSSVVSKWLGETEKNLNRIFDAAQARELVLFFDEADALFGRRSEVSDAHDRYANVEVAYLLQRLETYDGLIVLATNLQRNIDPAFMRRISMTIDFTAPDEAQRLAIWERAIPAKAPQSEVDREFLARQFAVTGGVIHNAALAAAFLAAESDGPITMEHLARAMDREYQKLGRLRTEAEFADLYWVVDDSVAG